MTCWPRPNWPRGLVGHIGSVDHNGSADCNGHVGRNNLDYHIGLVNLSNFVNPYSRSFELIDALNSEGAGFPSSKLIVRCGYSKIYFHFCEDCRIFCEGVKDSSTIDIVSNNGINGLISSLVRLEDHNGLFSLISFIGLIALGDFGFSLIGLIGLIGHISLDDSSASWNHWPISLIGIIVFGLIASSASAISSAHWLIGLVSLGLAAALIAAKTIIL